ncbi:MAG: hypothetical protein ACT4P6_01615 [Gemmatimonadaceae bacterium]
MERALEIYAAVHFFVIGLSHALQPRVWVAFFLQLRKLGHAGVFANAFLSLLFGSIIVAFHNIWSGLPMVLTIMGWAQVTKALLYFTVPRIGERSMARVSHERAYEFVPAGVFFIILGLLMVYLVLR